jgi:FkbM family methyltransferase
MGKKLMSILYKFNKAEYIFKPTQLIKRITRSGFDKTDSIMPWGKSLHYNPKEDIGKAINVLGIYELPLTELMYRGLQHCDHFVDVGANIGYFTSLASSLKNIKTIQSFEPHPFIFEILKRNSNGDKIKLNAYAASSVEGKAELYIPKDFEFNMGIASLEKPEDQEIERIEIDTKKLDDILNKEEKYCMKIDTEGHEASVLEGASSLLENKCFEYIFFEEFDSYPEAKSFKLLMENDYIIYRIERGFWGPQLDDPSSVNNSKRWQPVNFLAVPKESDNVAKITRAGWEILKL